MPRTKMDSARFADWTVQAGASLHQTKWSIQPPLAVIPLNCCIATKECLAAIHACARDLTDMVDTIRPAAWRCSSGSRRWRIWAVGGWHFARRVGPGCRRSRQALQSTPGFRQDTVNQRLTPEILSAWFRLPGSEASACVSNVLCCHGSSLLTPASPAISRFHSITSTRHTQALSSRPRPESVIYSPCYLQNSAAETGVFKNGVHDQLDRSAGHAVCGQDGSGHVTAMDGPRGRRQQPGAAPWK